MVSWKQVVKSELRYKAQTPYVYGEVPKVQCLGMKRAEFYNGEQNF
jgi:hypothetical protein